MKMNKGKYKTNQKQNKTLKKLAKKLKDGERSLICKHIFCLSLEATYDVLKRYWKFTEDY